MEHFTTGRETKEPFIKLLEVEFPPLLRVTFVVVAWPQMLLKNPLSTVHRWRERRQTATQKCIKSLSWNISMKSDDKLSPETSPFDLCRNRNRLNWTHFPLRASPSHHRLFRKNISWNYVLKAIKSFQINFVRTRLIIATYKITERQH